MSIDWSCVSGFDAKVYQALMRVPRGRVTTYKLLAHAAGCGSARAIGQSLRRNPFAPEVPCHRVINSDLRIGGFQGSVGGEEIRLKLKRLREEGVEFANGRLQDSVRVFDPWE